MRGARRVRLLLLVFDVFCLRRQQNSSAGRLGRCALCRLLSARFLLTRRPDSFFLFFFFNFFFVILTFFFFISRSAFAERTDEGGNASSTPRKGVGFRVGWCNPTVRETLDLSNLSFETSRRALGYFTIYAL